MDVSQIQEAQEATNQISMEKLNDYDYLINNFYVVDKTTTITSSQLNASQLLQQNMGIAQDNSVPQILIYHTHSQESFVDSIPGDPSTTIVGVGEYLTTLLRDKYHFNVIHHTEVYDMIDGKLDRSKAYALAETSIAQILADNPSIEVVIDLHRDGVAEGTHLVTNINGKDTAQFMFFNGLSRTTKIGDISYLPNPYIQDNLASVSYTHLDVYKRQVKDRGRAAEMTRQDDRTLTRWVAGMLKKEQKNIREATLQLLLSKTGSDMENICQELEKLICYTMDRPEISDEDVEEICTTQIANKIFDMIGAVTEQNQKKALKLYYDLLALKEPPMRILFLISRQFNQLMQVKNMKNLGLDSSTIAKQAGLAPFLVKKYAAQTGRFTLEQLREAVEDLSLIHI